MVWEEVHVAREENRRELILSVKVISPRVTETSTAVLDPNIFTLVNLNFLDLSSTPQITKLSDEVRNLVNLTSLVMSHNAHEKLPAGNIFAKLNKFIQLQTRLHDPFPEWDRENVIMTGSSDGVVRMWFLDYMEVPESTNADEADKNEYGYPSEVSSITRLAKKMSISVSGDCLSSLLEAIAQSRHSERSDPSSDTEDADELEMEEETEQPPVDKSLPIDGPPEICVTNEDFVVVSNNELRLVEVAGVPRHVKAFEGPDNIEPGRQQGPQDRLPGR